MVAVDKRHIEAAAFTKQPRQNVFGVVLMEIDQLFDTRLFYDSPPGVMKNAGLEGIHHRMRAPVDAVFE